MCTVTIKQSHRPSPTEDPKKVSLRKQVLLRCFYRAQQGCSTKSRAVDSHGRNTVAEDEMDLEWSSQCNERAISSRTPRRVRTHLPGAQGVIQNRIDEIKRCMRNVHLNAWFLRHAAALRCCPASYSGDPKTYFVRKLQYLLRYRDHHVLDWETELQTLLGALRAPPWNKKYWRDCLSLVLDSIQVVIEAM
ncbi:hypothetical protein MVEN_02007800 [Mycena venus]|uniref:Uncharacterized protein n=1 Tax=Mycena venus TaxID=2733690 RepID=A0A8H6XCB1_9AGAR|nr:hypothetical protein MVEN_02007800 [Mycena venus]